MSKKIKIFGYVSAGTLCLLLILLLLISSGALNPTITKILNKVGSQQMNGTLTIERIEGNIFHEFSLNQISITDQQNPVITIASIDLSFDIWQLKQKLISIEYLKISQTQLSLIETADSLWNIEKLFPSSAPPSNNSQALDWNIHVAEIQLLGFEGHIEALDSSLGIPHHVKCNTTLNITIDNDKKLVNLLNFELQTEHPTFQVQGLSFSAALSDSVFHWSKLELKLANSNISSSGEFALNNPFLSQLTFSASPLYLEDFKPWLSNIYGAPTLDLSIENTHGRSNIHLDATCNQQKLKMNGTIEDYNSIPKYQMVLETDSLDFDYWTHQSDLATNIKGRFKIDGEGFDLRKNSLKVLAQFTTMTSKERGKENISFDFTKEQSDLDAKINANTGFGDVKSHFTITDVFEVPSYDGQVNLSHVNIGRISADKNLTSDLNIDLKATGKGYKPGEMNSRIQFNLNRSVLFNEAINNMFANIQIAEDNYSIEGFTFESSYLSASINGHGNLLDKNKLNFQFKSNHLAPILNAFDISPFYFDGAINGHISGPIDALELNADIAINEFEMDSIILKNARTNINTFVSLDPNKRSSNHTNTIPYLTDITAQNISVKTRGHVDTFAVNSRMLEELAFDTEKKQESVSGHITATGQMGTVAMQLEVNHVFSIPQYTFNATLNHVNLEKISTKEALSSDLNLDIKAKGKGIDKATLNLEMEIKSMASELLGETLDDFDSKINYAKGAYQIKRFRFSTPSLMAQVTGEGDIFGHNKLGYHIKINDSEKINSLLKATKTGFKGELFGELEGTSDSLNISSTMNIDHFQMDTIRVEKIQAYGSLKTRNSNYSGELNLGLYNTIIQDLEIKNVQFSSTFTQDKSSNSFTYYASDSLQGKILTEMVFNENPTLYFNEIALQFQNSVWEGGSNNTFIQFGEDTIEINELNINSNSSSIKADGTFAFKGNENLHLRIQDMDLQGIPGIQLFPYPVSGNLNGSLALSGTATNPTIEGAVSILNPVIDTLQLKEIASTYKYSQQTLNMSAFVDDDVSRLISASLNLPYQLSFNQTVNIPPNEMPMALDINIDNFDIDRINRLMPQEGTNIKGLFTANLQLRNTLSDPKISGDITIQDGGLSYDKLGMNYKDIALNSHLKNNTIHLDSLNMYTAKGELKLKGIAEMGDLYQTELKTFDFNISAKDFKLFDSEITSAVINTNLNLKGSPEKPSFAGQLTLIKSMFNVDLFMKEYDRVQDNSEPPMLIVARNSANQNMLKNDTKKDTLQQPTPDIYKNMKGKFDIVIPKNTWIKGKNMNFELDGSIKAIKESEQLDLFGTVNVKRGYYKLYGKQLNFLEGSMTFTGGTTMNPLVNFSMLYRFRDIENNLRRLKVNISGRLLEPKVDFYLDEVTIEEKDAISYLIFNKGLHQLDTRENNTVLNSNMDLALGQLSNVVTDVLQSKIGLDIVEIRGNNGWTQSTITTGKYLTNNLFLNYEHTFAIDKKDKVIEPHKITLEYQFYRSLFLQATNQSSNSGFDFVLKWTWK